VPGRHTIQHRAAWIGGGKVAAIGQQRRAQPGDPALPYGPCCLARFVDAAPPWRPAHDQENRKIRLAASLQKSLPEGGRRQRGHTEVQSTPACCHWRACLARGFLAESWEFGWWRVVTVCCAVSVLFPLQRPR